MKILIMMLLASMSSVVMANGDYAQPSAAQYRDSAGGNSFSDRRYRAQYSPTQRQGFIDQRNAAMANRSNAEMAKRSNHANEMQQYYASERASKQFIDESIGYDNQPITIQPQFPSQGQYYPYSGNNNYYGNGGVQMRFTPAQTQSFINQNNIDRARQAQAAQEQAEANYEKWRQYQNGRREYERFIGD